MHNGAPGLHLVLAVADPGWDQDRMGLTESYPNARRLRAGQDEVSSPVK